MHSADLTVQDEYKTDSLNKMISFLETVQFGMKEKYDITNCASAIASLKKVSYLSVFIISVFITAAV